jgi:REP element-mobilizing transposase RayT
MARKARSIEPGLLCHVTQRGNNREPVFKTDQDRFDYLSLLRLLSEPTGVKIFGYCLMPNHVHLVLRPRGEDCMAVQAHIVEQPCEYRWSSAAAHCLKDEFGLLSMEWTTWWIRRHTRLGRRLGQARINAASIPA